MKISLKTTCAILILSHSLARADQYNGKTLDAGDYYMLSGGNKVSLVRATEEVAVRYKVPLSAVEAVQRVKQASSDSSVSLTASSSSPGTARIDILHVADSEKTKKSLAATSDVALATIVFVNPQTHNRLILTDEVVVGARESVKEEQLVASLRSDGLELVEKLRPERLNAYKFRVTNPDGNALTASLVAASKQEVRFAEPNFIQEWNLEDIPNDPYFPLQQALRNTGQNNATSGSDIKADQAWNISTGDPNIVIAIIDTGVDLSHPDLVIATNPGETGGGKENNGIDDDLNGYIDDWHGWDFSTNNNNPQDDEGHGTSCAGIAAAIGNNSYGISGIARNCKVFPVKVAQGGMFVGNATLATAISYAAARADVLSCSWGGGSQSSLIDSAITDATLNGRSGKGCPVFFASGNAASNWDFGGGRVRWPALLTFNGSTYSYLPNGSYYIGFWYIKNASGAAGEDLAKLDNLEILGADGYTLSSTGLGANGRQDFESTFPPLGWTLITYPATGVNKWTASNVSAFKGTLGTKSTRSGAIANNQQTMLRTPLLALTSSQTLAFDMYTSSESGADGLIVSYYNSSGTYVGQGYSWSGVNSVNTAVAYPASSTDSISVGSATDTGLNNLVRSDYSQYGPNLDLVVPSNGGFNDIVSLDVSGGAGRSSDDINRGFGGTSAACPLAAGVGALMLSVNPQLTSSQVRHILHEGCQRAGGTYTFLGEPVDGDGLRYSEFGYGLVNAWGAVGLANAMNTPPSAYYKIDDYSFTGTSPQNVYDSSGNGITASLIQANPVNPSVWRKQNSGHNKGCLYGSCAIWDGVTCVSVPNSSGQVLNTSNNAPFSMAMWIYPISLVGGAEYVLATNEVAGQSGFRLTVVEVQFNVAVKLRFSSTQGGGSVFVESPTFSVNNEHHIAVTYDGNSAIIYIDGQQVAVTSGSIIGNSQNIRAGAGISGLRTLAANLDEIRFYKTAITSPTVADLIKIPKF